MGLLYDITPFTLLDYPGETACVAWFAGCNLRCVYCHNPDIVEGRGERDVEELLAFLKKRAGLLSGVVFSGGEATYYPGLADLMRQAKELGYKVKLDTNGARPDVLADLLREGLLDYVALDYKCPPERAVEITGTDRYTGAFGDSLALLIAWSKKGLAFEVRTTLHADLLSDEELGRMIEDLDKSGYRGTYYIQNVVSFGDKTLGGVDKPARAPDFASLPKPANFTVAFRNFAEEAKKES
ncbi:MAG: anaerobic ribonucleoside-triphosphate reductase activating protein [Alphaproteobacteria bacterium]|nr:anaerobic ribonucleoside-triphosphate reductase activating protein [Alphaproteobacteria bacterium]